MAHPRQGGARLRATARMRMTTRQTVQLHGIIKSNLKATLKADRRGAAQFHCGLRRRQPQRDVQSESAPVARARRGDRARACDFGSSIAAHAGLSRDLARRRAHRRRRRRSGRADLRQDLYAAEIQGRGGGAAVERCRHICARSRLHRHPRRCRRRSPAGT